MDGAKLQELVEDLMPDWRHYFENIFEAAVDLEIIDEDELPSRFRVLDFNNERANWKRVATWHDQFGDEDD